MTTGFIVGMGGNKVAPHTLASRPKPFTTNHLPHPNYNSLKQQPPKLPVKPPYAPKVI